MRAKYETRFPFIKVNGYLFVLGESYKRAITVFEVIIVQIRLFVVVVLMRANE